jgi:hypothetical protein
MYETLNKYVNLKRLPIQNFNIHYNGVVINTIYYRSPLHLRKSQCIGTIQLTVGYFNLLYPSVSLLWKVQVFLTVSELVQYLFH